MLYQEAERRYDELYRAKSILEKNSGKYPEGRIHVVQNKGKVQYYVRFSPNDKSGTYLSKRQKDTIRSYLQKKYEEEVLKLLNSEIAILEKFLKKSGEIGHRIQSSYSENPLEIRNYLSPIDMYDADVAREWQETPFQCKAVANNVPVFVTRRGEHVRSKSELMIANRLSELNIPYKYECPLILSDGRTIYPDFTVWNAWKRREVYWEHRGMMDNQEYANHTVQRIKDYRREGIYLGENLIVTEETSAIPLDTGDIDSVIHHYFNESGSSGSTREGTFW